MANNIGKDKKIYGSITKKLVTKLLTNDSKNLDTDSDTIVPAGSRALRVDFGRKHKGFGRKIRSTNYITKVEDLRDVDIKNVLSKIDNKFISSKNGKLYLNTSSNQDRSVLGRFLRNQVNQMNVFKAKHKDAIKNTGSTIKELVAETIGATLTKYPTLANASKEKVEEWKNTLDTLVDLQIKHFSSPIGMRKMRGNIVTRIAEVMDMFTEELEKQIDVCIDNKKEVSFPALDLLKEKLAYLGKHNGHVEVNDLIRNFSEMIQENRTEKFLKEVYLPHTKEELAASVDVLSLSIGSKALKLDEIKEILYSSVYKNALEEIKRFPMPIAKTSVENIKSRLVELGLSLSLDKAKISLELENLFPKEAIINQVRDSETARTDILAETYVNVLNLITEQVKNPNASLENITNYSNSLRKLLPSGSALLEYTVLVKEFDGNTVVKNPQEISAFALPFAHNLFSFYHEHSIRKFDLTSLKTSEARLEVMSREYFNHQLENRIDGIEDRVNKIRLHRLQTGLYNVFLGQTGIGQITRNGVRLAGLATGAGLGGYIADVAINPLSHGIISSGGNALLEVFREASIQALGLPAKLGVAVAGGAIALAPTSLGIHSRRVRNLNTQGFTGVARRANGTGIHSLNRLDRVNARVRGNFPETKLENEDLYDEPWDRAATENRYRRDIYGEEIDTTSPTVSRRREPLYEEVPVTPAVTPAESAVGSPAVTPAESAVESPVESPAGSESGSAVGSVAGRNASRVSPSRRPSLEPRVLTLHAEIKDAVATPGKRLRNARDSRLSAKGADIEFPKVNQTSAAISNRVAGVSETTRKEKVEGLLQDTLMGVLPLLNEENQKLVPPFNGRSEVPFTGSFDERLGKVLSSLIKLDALVNILGNKDLVLNEDNQISVEIVKKVRRALEDENDENALIRPIEAQKNSSINIVKAATDSFSLKQVIKVKDMATRAFFKDLQNFDTILTSLKNTQGSTEEGHGYDSRIVGVLDTVR